MEVILKLYKKRFSGIHLKIKGHSRGAIAAGALFKKLKKPIRQIEMKYDYFDISVQDVTEPIRLIKRSLRQVEPVPGPSYASSGNKYRNYYEDLDIYSDDDRGSEDDESERSEVIFSVNPKGMLLNRAFKMQHAFGHKVVIITEEDHDGGLSRLDYDDSGQVKKQLYFDSISQRALKISDLESGIYYAENDDTLHSGQNHRMFIYKITDNNFKNYIDRIDEKAAYSRVNFLKELVYSKILKIGDIEKVCDTFKLRIAKETEFISSKPDYLVEIFADFINDLTNEKHLYKFSPIKSIIDSIIALEDKYKGQAFWEQLGKEVRKIYQKESHAKIVNKTFDSILKIIEQLAEFYSSHIN